MNAFLRTPVRRIALAIALSAMLHIVILWLPHWQSPHEKVHLPRLTARLEYLPKPVEQAKPEPVKQLSRPDGKIAEIPKNNAAQSMKPIEKSTTVPPFPKHLQLVFTVYKSDEVSRTGELRHQLDVDRDSYSLKATRLTAGLTSLVNNDKLILTSNGKLDERGLQPVTYKEEIFSGKGKQEREVTFDWKAKKLYFSSGGDSVLPADAQDILSYMYQLSQISMLTEVISLPISEGSYLKQVQLEVGITEDIATPMGKLRARHLRKLHVQGEPDFEIWLGLEYRLLPVKYRRVDDSGNVIEEFEIEDIRASDD